MAHGEELAAESHGARAQTDRCDGRRRIRLCSSAIVGRNVSDAVSAGPLTVSDAISGPVSGHGDLKMVRQLIREHEGGKQK